VLRSTLKRHSRIFSSPAGSDEFAAVFESAAIGIALVDLEGRPVRVNPALRRMLGYEASELARMRFTEFTHPDDATADWDLFQELLRGERTSYAMEKRYLCRDGRVLHGSLTVSLIRDEGTDEPLYVIGMVEDVTARVAAEARLAEAEERYRNLVERLPVVVYVNGVGGNEAASYISPAYERMFGFTAEERMADPSLWRSRLHPDDRDRVLAEAASSERERRPFRTEYRYVHKDGHVVWVREEGALILGEDGRPAFWQGIVLDVTEAKAAEAALAETLNSLRRSDEQRAALMTKLANAQEDERHRIASDLHDDTIQKLTAAGLRVEMLRAQRPELASDPHLERLSGTIGDAIASLRALVFDLHPPALDAGLGAAIQWYVDEQRRNDDRTIDYRTTVELASEAPELVSVTAYRVVREAVANARKHAEASAVDVRVFERDGAVVVRIADDGNGAGPCEDEAGRGKHFGLADLRERVALAGGKLEVRSMPGRGTTVEARLPRS
jgi:PAS domain S-box-containing protein